MSHYHRGYYCKKLYRTIAVDQFHMPKLSLQEMRNRKEQRTNIYRRPERRKRYGSGKNF